MPTLSFPPPLDPSSRHFSCTSNVYQDLQHFGFLFCLPNTWKMYFFLLIGFDVFRIFNCAHLLGKLFSHRIFYFFFFKFNFNDIYFIYIRISRLGFIGSLLVPQRFVVPRFARLKYFQQQFNKKNNLLLKYFKIERNYWFLPLDQ